jgi:hypothetical protein
MPSSPHDLAVDDADSTGSVLTAYDERHAITHLRLLDAEAERADWKEVKSPTSLVRSMNVFEPSAAAGIPSGKVRSLMLSDAGPLGHDLQEK